MSVDASSSSVAAVHRLQRVLRLASVSGEGVRSGSYSAVVQALAQQCEEAGLHTSVYEPVAHKPVLVATRPGSDTSLPSLLLSGHYDVVPVDDAMWTSPPFAAEIRDGCVYARGVQDMKGVLCAYIEALRCIGPNPPLLRTVHVCFVPDEEIGGMEGMATFAKTPAFQSLNVGFALDEGLASGVGVSSVPVFYGERAVWWLRLRSQGATGHSSKFYSDDGAISKLIRCLRCFESFRDDNIRKLGNGAAAGDVASVNITALKSGHTSDNGASFALNVIPSMAEAGVDLRLPPSLHLGRFYREQVQHWTSSNDVACEMEVGSLENPVTDVQSAWFKTFEGACANVGIEIDLQVFPAATDSRFLRAAGVPSIGFSPFPNTPVLLHDHDEHLSIKRYLDGVRAYQQIITALAQHSC